MTQGENNERQVGGPSATPVRLGVLGCASIAWRRTLPAAVAEPLLWVVAVASRDPDKAGRFARHFGCEAVRGYEELLGRDDVDAVYIPLPVALHARWIEAALRAGKHVLAEKPLAEDAATADRLVSLARSRGLLLAENYMFTYHTQHEAVRRLVAGGAIGELRAFFAAFTIPRLPPDDIRNQRQLGGGALLDVAGYPIRAAELFLGDGLEVTGAVLRYDPVTKVDTGGAALLRTPSGVTAQITFGIENAYRSSYELWGSTGRIGVDRAFTPPPDHRPVVRVETQDGTEESVLDADDQFARVVRAFARGVLDGTGDLPAGSGHGTDAIVPHARLVDTVRRLGG
ncbi:Gfo/Idh/MocA family oxidoreductase [Streptomyces sp. NPDC013178]|uniref:Gfo/Idh/MocA family protein n=1 Tax=Streptomyces sp. NPDC013178 TaxID=3155118 RepID=UPI0033C9A018